MKAATPTGAVCARHPASAAVDVCARCGTFVCAQCIELSKNDEVFCEPCFELVETANRRSRLAPVATLLLLLGIGLMLAGSALGLLTGFAGAVMAIVDWRRGSKVPKVLIAVAAAFGLLLLVALLFVARFVLTR